MRNKNNEPRDPQRALRAFLQFIEDDPRTMDGADLDAYLTENRIDYSQFSARLDKDIELAQKKQRLLLAQHGRQSFLSKAKQVVDTLTMTIEAKRAEIQRKLGALDGTAATVFSRKYEIAEEEDDLDELLRDLRDLEQRAKTRG